MIRVGCLTLLFISTLSAFVYAGNILKNELDVMDQQLKAERYQKTTDLELDDAYKDPDSKKTSSGVEIVVKDTLIPQETMELSQGRAFVVDSSKLDESDSLNRISGNIDRGYSSDDQSFKSDNHYAPGLAGREKAATGSR